MKLEYIDAHSHLYFPDYDKDREEVIEKMKKEKVGTICIGTDFVSSEKCLDLAKTHHNIFACVGQHPGDLRENSIFDENLRKLAQDNLVVAIGECGLDYFRIPHDGDELKMIQKTIFEYHVDLALDLDKPLMLHIRNSKGKQDAYLDALQILEHHYNISGGKLKGNAHFFSGDEEILKRLIMIGFTVSFTGVITFTDDYDELIKLTPLENILAETDAPFVAPTPHRGKRNSPQFVKEVVKRIAEIREEDIDMVKKALFNNVLTHFPKVKENLASFGLL